MSQTNTVHPLRIANAAASVRHVFIRDLTLDCSIGIYDHEKVEPQRVRFNLDLTVRETHAPLNDDIANVVCYEKITDDIRALVARGHVNLVETLAESVAELCLTNPLVETARVRIEKLDVFADATCVGVEIERNA
ncbi:MAG: dihydroneopterin aldolase [Alphaproteobacteria bacterium]|nr:dihydroneopterin aldolase [Alphaproteobacteria bacterium]